MRRRLVPPFRLRFLASFAPNNLVSQGDLGPVLSCSSRRSARTAACRTFDESSRVARSRSRARVSGSSAQPAATASTAAPLRSYPSCRRLAGGRVCPPRRQRAECLGSRSLGTATGRHLRIFALPCSADTGICRRCLRRTAVGQRTVRAPSAPIRVHPSCRPRPAPRMPLRDPFSDTPVLRFPSVRRVRPRKTRSRRSTTSSSTAIPATTVPVGVYCRLPGNLRGPYLGGGHRPRQWQGGRCCCRRGIGAKRPNTRSVP
jgi:hypothetical protein